MVLDCSGCGRDIHVKDRTYVEGKEHYCRRCIGHASHLNESKGRGTMRLANPLHEDSYGDESGPEIEDKDA